MSTSTYMSIVLSDDGPLDLPVNAQPPRGSLPGIGSVKLTRDICVQASNPDQLLAVAAAFKEAARRLQAAQVALVEDVPA